MTNNFIAKEFLMYCEAGLSLVGQNKHKELEWVGDEECWDKLEELTNEL